MRSPERVRAEMYELAKKRDAIKATVDMPGWQFIKEWYRQQREPSLVGLADQVLQGDPLMTATAARIQVSTEFENADETLLEQIDAELRSLKQDYEQLRAVNI